MALSKSKVGFIVALTVISLAGLIVVQVMLLNNAKQLKEKTFDNNVSLALGAVTDAIETKLAMSVIIEVAGSGDDLDSISITATTGDSVFLDSLQSKMLIIRRDTVLPSGYDSDSTISINLDMSAGVDSFKHLNEVYLKHGILNDSQRVEVFRDLGNACQNVIGIATSAESNRAAFIQEILNKMWVSEMIPVEDRLDSAVVDSSLAASLHAANIETDFVFGVKPDSTDSLIMSPSGFVNDLLASKYRVRLFPFDVLSPPTELLLYFPDQQVYLWQQIIPMLIIVGIFILIITTCFIYTIKVILLQRRNEVLMKDFVNNMTHEFKTPISTIALASEAILRSDVLPDGDKVSKYSRMIQEENLRMRRQAEVILQMAALEEGDLKLNRENVNLHDLINTAADNTSLQVKKREGKVICNLKANRSVISADRVHMTGIINNLLDNACKYTREAPEILIDTINDSDGIYVRIADNGIGIKGDDLKLIFKKYYRVSSGNIHDTKGFGLGLSYVKLMTEAHGGNVSIRSKPGEGTRVELYFPVIKGIDNG